MRVAGLGGSCGEGEVVHAGYALDRVMETVPALPARSLTTFNRPENCVIHCPVNLSTHTRSAHNTAAIPRRCPPHGLVQHPLELVPYGA